ncbi:hypothetical protein [Candidatus Poriferisodalis sp.]|uniref:hypothetical protein n=1 Tax=Candidatus Poriferisodalis sp. TaxID=3101277 RepID=UPI003B01E6CE
MTNAAKRGWQRLRKLIVPGFLVLYLVMIPLHALAETDHVEVFPFFKWKLFTHIPDWQSSEYGLVVDRVDGEAPGRSTYLIPSDDVRDWKALRRVAIACAKDRGCDKQITEVLHPILQRKLGERRIEFSIVKAEVDLREVQAKVTDLADGRMSRTDFFRPSEVIVRWDTGAGRIADRSGTDDGTISGAESG